jgi:hypothetical protein
MTKFENAIAVLLEDFETSPMTFATFCELIYKASESERNSRYGKIMSPKKLKQIKLMTKNRVKNQKKNKK